MAFLLKPLHSRFPGIKLILLDLKQFVQRAISFSLTHLKKGFSVAMISPGFKTGEKKKKK